MFNLPNKWPPMDVNGESYANKHGRLRKSVETWDVILCDSIQISLCIHGGMLKWAHKLSD